MPHILVGKPGISKGGQTVIIGDVDHLHPRAYIHHHKKPRCWTKQGPFEVKCILDDVKNMVHVDGDSDDDDVEDNGMYLWDQLPHFTGDNYLTIFVGDQIFDYMGNKGFGALMICR